MTDTRASSGTAWSPPAELRQMPPRLVHPTWLGKFNLIASWGMMIFALPAGWLLLQGGYERDIRSVQANFVGAGFFVLMLLGIGAGSQLVFRRRRHLLMNGLPARGTISRSWRVKGGYVGRYDFWLPDDSIRKGSGRLTERLEHGEVICVLYDPEKPGTSMPYPSRLFSIT